MGLNVFQSVLLLDTEHSKKLKKEKQLNVYYGGNEVNIKLDEEGGIQFDVKPVNKEIKVVELDDETIYLKKETIDKLKLGEQVLTTYGKVKYDIEKETYLLEPKKIVKIENIIYRG